MTQRPTLTITERVPFANGHAFDEAGPYERVTGKASFRIDPQGPLAAVVTDLDKADRAPDGLVSVTADFCILRPRDLARGNGRIFFDYGNRGNKRALQYICDAPGSNDPIMLDHAGNGYLFRRGYSIVWLAWQGDLLPGDGRMLIDVPLATENGAPITGLVRADFIAAEPGTTVFPLSTLISTRSYPVASLDTRQARLTRRRYAESPRIEIPAAEWAFARVEEGNGVDGQGLERSIIPSSGHLHLPAGFETGWIYEIVYTARDPLVLGLGHVAVRDFISFLKHEAVDAAGTPNPLREGDARIEKAYAWGRSQTGRCIRDFVYLGFNADADARRVFDGVMPHVAGAGKMWMNHRFANIVLLPGQDYENHDTVADRFPFSYTVSTDHLTGRTDGILKRPETDPLVIHTDSASEYWQRRASLVHTDTRGEDLAPPENVRLYFWASSKHVASPRMGAPVRGLGQALENVVSTSMLFRANLDALDRWATTGEPPAPSRIPKRADGSLVGAGEWRAQFPAIPGVAMPRGPSTLEVVDFGPDLDRGFITHQPPLPVPGQSYPVAVPAVDADGNDVAGVHAPMAAVPLGTYTGWNLRQRHLGNGALLGVSGSYFPLADTPDERARTGDPRPSILERHPDAAAYARAIRAAAEALVAERLMLEEDVARAEALAADWGRPRHVTRLGRDETA
jgi:hypothetical protein